MSEIAEALNVEDGDDIKEISGKITQLYKAEDKEGSNGAYTLQNGVLETEWGPIKFSSFDNSLPQSARGRSVTFIAGRNPKTKKIAGITYGIYKDKEQLRLTGAATIEYEGGEPAGGEKRDPERSKPENTASGRSVAPSRMPSKTKSTHAVKAAVLIHSYIVECVEARHPDIDPETKRSYVATLFIALDKQGIIGQSLGELIEKDMLGVAIPPRAKGAKPAPEPEPDPEDDEVDDEEVAKEQEERQQEEPDDAEEEDDIPKEDYSDTVMLAGPHEGKKLAQVFASGPSGRRHLQSKCIGYNEKGFNTAFSKRLRQFCLDFNLIEMDGEEAIALPLTKK